MDASTILPSNGLLRDWFSYREIMVQFKAVPQVVVTDLVKLRRSEVDFAFR